LPPILSAALSLLRLFILAVLVFFFLQPERRTQQRVGRPSEAVVLVDTSQSMSLAARDGVDSLSRLEVAQQLVEGSPMLDDLSAQNRVTVYLTGNGQEPEQVLVRGPTAAAENSSKADPQLESIGQSMRAAAWIGSILLVIGSVFLLTAGLDGWRYGADRAQKWVMGGVLCAMVGGVMLASTLAVGATIPFAELWGFAPNSAPETPEAESLEPAIDNAKLPELVADGQRSALGESLQWISKHHDAETLSSIFLLTDGQSNSGLSLEAAARNLTRISVPAYPIGLGSAQPPINIRVVDMEAPPRVYPGDRFAIAATLQAVGNLEEEVEVQLLDALDADPWQPQVMESRRVKFPNDGTPVQLQFELEPGSVGRRQIGIRLAAARGEQNTEDNQLTARYEVIARRLRVMVIAGGPTREYQFVRNLLHRDREVTLDVWLQSGEKGMSQDASELLTEFPATAEDLFEYDAIVAFDPDWDLLSAAQVELLDRWVAEQAGGFVLVGGPVYTPRLASGRADAKSKLRSLLPVVLAGRLLSIDEGRYAGEEAWPVQWTEDGRRADFLGPVDTPAESQAIWQSFSGFYGFFAAREPKPGATVYARYSDPTTAADGQLPILMASQFYGAGRSFFLGSGELWRLRTEGDAYFDRIYTKLVRWAAEGRLLRDSNRGFLLVDPPRAVLGDTISIRAVLLDDQFQPLELPEVEAQILEPGRAIRSMNLRRLEGQPRGGTYGGQFVVRYSGQYEVRIELGDVTNRQILRDTIQVRMPTSELERPRRNDADLEVLASLSQGKYLPLGNQPASDLTQNVTALLSQVVPRPQETVLPGTQDRDFQRRRNAGVMWCIAVAIILEWVLRRLNRLA
jgi:hypothetical protein